MWFERVNLNVNDDKIILKHVKTYEIIQCN